MAKRKPEEEKALCSSIRCKVDGPSLVSIDLSFLCVPKTHWKVVAAQCCDSKRTPYIRREIEQTYKIIRNVYIPTYHIYIYCNSTSQPASVGLAQARPNNYHLCTKSIDVLTLE